MGESVLIRSYVNMLRNYARFTGRTERTEYWVAMLMHISAALILFILYSITKMSFFSYLFSLYQMMLLVPTYSLNTRRLHDIGKSGWWQLIGASVIGGIILLIWLARRGETDENLYGADPLPVLRY